MTSCISLSRKREKLPEIVFKAVKGHFPPKRHECKKEGGLSSGKEGFGGKYFVIHGIHGLRHMEHEGEIFSRWPAGASLRGQ